MLKAKEAAANTVFFSLDTTSSQNRTAVLPPSSVSGSFQTEKIPMLVWTGLEISQSASYHHAV